MTVVVHTEPGVASQAVTHAQRILHRQSILIAAVTAGVVWLDQITKAWAWRHLLDVHINSGGDALSTARLSAWLRAPASGAVFDVLDSALLVGAALLLGRSRRPPGVTFFGALAVAGWASNLLDRLGMHYVTAPGSTRGAVDFLPFAGRYWNLADAAIVTGTAGLLVAMSVAVLAHPVRTARVRVTRDLLGSRWALAVVSAGVTASVVLATIGAVDYGTLSGPA